MRLMHTLLAAVAKRGRELNSQELSMCAWAFAVTGVGRGTVTFVFFLFFLLLCLLYGCCFTDACVWIFLFALDPEENICHEEGSSSSNRSMQTIAQVAKANIEAFKLNAQQVCSLDFHLHFYFDSHFDFENLTHACIPNKPQIMNLMTQHSWLQSHGLSPSWTSTLQT